MNGAASTHAASKSMRLNHCGRLPVDTIGLLPGLGRHSLSDGDLDLQKRRVSRLMSKPYADANCRRLGGRINVISKLADCVVRNKVLYVRLCTAWLADHQWTTSTTANRVPHICRSLQPWTQPYYSFSRAYACINNKQFITLAYLRHIRNNHTSLQESLPNSNDGVPAIAWYNVAQWYRE